MVLGGSGGETMVPSLGGAITVVQLQSEGEVFDTGYGDALTVIFEEIF